VGSQLTPELVQQMIAAVSPLGPGGYRITATEFRGIMDTLTSITVVTMITAIVTFIVSRLREIVVP